MGSRIIPANGRAALVGFAVADTRFTVDGLTSASSYTQTGPHPGTDLPASSASEFQVVVSGEQSAKLTLQATSAGLPVLDAARVSYRLDSEAASEQRGWNPANLLCGWTAAEYEAAATETYSLPSAAVIPSSQKVVVAYSITNSTGICKTWDPYSDTWTARQTILAEATTGSVWAVACLPDERLLALRVGTTSTSKLGVLYSSSDAGATWSLWADRVLPPASTSTTAKDRVRLLRSGDDLLYWQHEGTTSRHFASSTLGTSWQSVETWTTHNGVTDVAILGDGRVLCLSIKNGTSHPEYRIAPSVWDPISTIAVAEIAQVAVDEVSCCVDQAGVIWVFGRYNQSIYVWRSSDAGETWTEAVYGLFYAGISSTGAAPIDMAPVSAGGAVRIVHQWQATSGDEEASIGLLTAGGWSNVTSEPVLTNVIFGNVSDDDRFGFGPYTGSGVASVRHTWLPFDLPSDSGYTATGAGTATLDNGAVEISTTANTKYYAPTAAISTDETFVGLFDCKVTTGGAVGSNDVAIRLRLSDGTNGQDLVVRLKTDTIRVRDVLAGTNTDVSVDCTSYLQLLICSIRGGYTEVFWRRPYSARWTLIVSTQLTNNNTITTGLLEWGHIASSTSASSWRLVAKIQVSSALAQLYAYPSSNVRTSIIGRNLTASPYPAGDAATAGAMFLAAVAGPAQTAETHTITPIYDYGVERAFWQVSPSLAEEWRSTSTAEQILEWTPGLTSSTDTSLDSRSIAVAFLGANFRTAYLEADEGAGYVLLGTYDGATGFSSGLTAVVDGDQVTPNTSTTADAGRYLQRGELAGATASVNSTYCYITQNEEGAWTQSATKRARLRVDRAVTAGSITIIARNGVLVVNGVSANYRKWRIRIPSQTTPDGYFRLAGLVIGGVVAPGLPWDWGWTEAAEPNVEEVISRRGTTRRKQEGPPRRVLTFAWADGGVPLSKLRTTANLDYLSPHSSLTETSAIAAHKDVPWLLAGLQRQAKSGEVPCVALKAIPDTATNATITDPTLWLYGRLDGSVAYAQVTGKTGSSEYVRVETMSVREIV